MNACLLGALNDTLWLPGSADWGGDNFDGYRGYAPPFTSMDMMAYAHSNAIALSRTSVLQGNRSGQLLWEAKAARVAAALKRVLWDPARSACYDRDSTGKTIDVLMHNNLRAMWHGAFDQSMADAFVNDHLVNRAEFWTPMPLPSIAANDPRFVPGDPSNNWSGAPEGLTYQRAIRALENYGHHAEVSLLGPKLLTAIGRSMTFPQQWCAQLYNGTPAGAAGRGDCYGPSALSALEYIALSRGIKIRPADGHLLWSSLDTPALGNETALSNDIYTQRLGDSVFTLRSSSASPEGEGEFEGKAI